VSELTRDAYEQFAPFYDAINGEPDELIRAVISMIEEHHPDATSVLELGCGTGTVLAGLGSGYRLTGVDFSPAMLSVASRKVPQATLHHADITNLDLGTHFDVVLCALDTMNHLTDIADWSRVFAVAAHHLAPGGLFLFDVNTVSRFHMLDEMVPWVHEFDEHTLVMSLSYELPLAHWQICLFEHLSGDNYRRTDGRITERAVVLDDIAALWGDHFSLVATSDTEGGPASDDAPRALFALQRR